MRRIRWVASLAAEGTCGSAGLPLTASGICFG
jgi:hypothetical protein